MNYLRVDLCPHVASQGCHLWKLEIASLVWRCVWCECQKTDQAMKSRMHATRR